MIRTPATALTLLARSFRHVLPRSKQQLERWQQRAEEIPNPELRRQALAALTTKRFHADGGSVYATAAYGPAQDNLIALIVAFQTISDYLDNLCDRSTSLDPLDFRQLHLAMIDAVTLDTPLRDYYLYREDRDDGGYLAELVNTCRACIARLPRYSVAAPYLTHLVALYCDLQVHKHVRHEERVGRLTAWFAEHGAAQTELAWWEFSAASGSTLGIFTYFLHAVDPEFDEGQAEAILHAYFPWVCGLHILLDYLIDQEEDLLGGDLNFVEYYASQERAYQRIELFAHKALSAIESLPDAKFHRLVIQGLIGMYLSDPKVLGHTAHREFAHSLTQDMGRCSSLFHWVSRYYRHTV
ncbi:MAG: tetraprenyl-beta-curcumene synthase family protein [Tumebacillaceae bacterium]